jgi:WD40 repeat protein
VSGLSTTLRDGPSFTADGSRLAVPGDRPAVVDARTHRLIARLRTTETEFAYRLRFSPDGRTLYAAMIDPPVDTDALSRFDARTGRQMDGASPIGNRRQFVTLDVMPDGRVVTSVEGGPTEIRDARTLRVLTKLPVGGDYSALSPDGRTLLLGHRDGSVGFLDLSNGKLRPASGRHEGAVVRAAISADGRTAVTAGEDDRVIVWDIRRAAASETLAGHAGQITGLALSRDARTLYTSSLDGSALIWDLSGSRRLGRPFATDSNDIYQRPRQSLSTDGRVLALGEDDGTVALFDTRTLQRVAHFAVARGAAVSALNFVPHSRTLVVGTQDGAVALVDSRRGTILQRLPSHHSDLGAITLSADGRVMVTMGWDGTVLFWKMRSGRPVGRPTNYLPSFSVSEVALSPDGSELALTTPVGIEILDVATQRPRVHVPGTERAMFSGHFSPDGRFLTGISNDGWVRVWSTKTWQPVTPRISEHAGAPAWASVSPDSRTLATGGLDGTVRLYDLRTQQRLGAPLPAVANRQVAPEFSPDGAYLFAITDAGRSYRWDVRPSSWEQRACAVAGRRLTRAEWREALPGRSYTPEC